MKIYLVSALFFCLAFERGSSSLCEDIVNGVDGDFTMEEVNECHQCDGWFKIQTDTRTSHSYPLTPFTAANMSRVGNPESAWCADDESDDYIQIDFGRGIKIAGLVTRGYALGFWVETYTVEYREGNGEFKYLKKEGVIEIFQGNEDIWTEVEQKFPVPITTSAVRIHPITSSASPCMQIDVYACTDQAAKDALAPLMDPSMANIELKEYCKITDASTQCEEKCLKYKIDWFGCELCECAKMKKNEKYEIDIDLTDLTKAAAEAGLGVGKIDEAFVKGASKIVQKWSTRVGGKIIVPYSYGGGLSSRAPAAIQAAIRELSSKTCIQLKRRSNEGQYINFVSRGGCSSPVGRQYRGNQVSIGYGCEHMGTVVHEILHSLGFWHEQSRPDRDGYVRILTQNIQPGMAYNFQKRATHEIDSFGSPYDLQSVMHYHGTAFTRNGQATIIDMQGNTVRGQRGGLSVEDAKQVNRMYSCSGGGGTGGTTQAPVTTVSPGGCSDNHRHCSFWAGIGECNKNPGYMRVNCKKSCKVCGGSNCADKNQRCTGWKKYCSSQTYSGYMTKYCAKTCGKC